MAFDPVAKLSEVLAGGYHRNNQLQALLSRPLDRRGQEVAMEFSQELSRVFVVSMAILDSNAAAPEVRMGNSSGVSTPTPVKDQRARSDSGEVVTPSKKSREEGVTSKEITPSPHKDGYQWRKYGQKKIQNCNFSRYYYRCNRHRHCLAKKKVQQQDGLLHPMFEVTYVNEHTCHALRASDDAASRLASPAGITSRHHAGAAGSSGNGGSGMFDPFPHIIGGGGGSAEEENEAIVSCLATVVSGAAPSPAPSSWWPPAAEATAGGDPAAAAFLDGSASDDGATMMTMMIEDIGFSSFCPVEEATQHHQLMANHHRDVHMDVTGFADTVWPQHVCGAWPWRRA